MDRTLRWGFYAFCGLMGFCLLTALLVPPASRIEGDSLDYRLILSSISPFWISRPDTYNSLMPQFWDMIRGFFIPWGAGWMRLPNILVYLGSGWVFFKVAGPLFRLRESYKLLGTWWILVTPAFFMQSSFIMVDIAASLALVLASLFYLKGVRDQKMDFVWIPLLIQAAISCHWWPWVPGAILAWFWIVTWRKSWLKQPWKLAVFLGLIAFPYPVFLLIRNFLETGNPVIPSLLGVFETTVISDVRAKEIQLALSTVGYGKSPLDFILLPFRLTFASDPLDYLGGALALAGLPLLLVKIHDPLVRRLRWMIVILYLGFFLGVQNTRFYGHLSFLMILFGMAWAQDQNWKGAHKRIASLAMVMTLLIYSTMALGLQATELGPRYLASGLDRERYLEKMLPRYDWVRAINKRFEGKKGTLGLGNRTGDSFYLEPTKIYFNGNVYGNLSAREPACEIVEKHGILGIYGGRERLSYVMRKNPCLKNFRLVFQEGEWAYYDVLD